MKGSSFPVGYKRDLKSARERTTLLKYKLIVYTISEVDNSASSQIFVLNTYSVCNFWGLNLLEFLFLLNTIIILMFCHVVYERKAYSSKILILDLSKEKSVRFIYRKISEFLWIKLPVLQNELEMIYIYNLSVTDIY